MMYHVNYLGHSNTRFYCKNLFAHMNNSKVHPFRSEFRCSFRAKSGKSDESAGLIRQTPLHIFLHLYSFLGVDENSTIYARTPPKPPHFISATNFGSAQRIAKIMKVCQKYSPKYLIKKFSFKNL